jgi:hypothetical protein
MSTTRASTAASLHRINVRFGLIADTGTQQPNGSFVRISPVRAPRSERRDFPKQPLLSGAAKATEVPTPPSLLHGA